MLLQANATTSQQEPNVKNRAVTGGACGRSRVLRRPFSVQRLLQTSSCVGGCHENVVLTVILDKVKKTFKCITPVVVRQTLSVTIPSGGVELLFSLMTTLVTVCIIDIVFAAVHDHVVISIDRGVVCSVHGSLFRRLRRLPFRCCSSEPRKGVLVQIIGCIGSMSSVLSGKLVGVILRTFGLLFVVVFVFVMSIRVTLIILYKIPILTIFVF